MRLYFQLLLVCSDELLQLLKELVLSAASRRVPVCGLCVMTEHRDIYERMSS